MVISVIGNRTGWTYRPALSCTACRNAGGFASGGGYDKIPLQYLEEDARDFPVSAPTMTSMPFFPRDRVAARADRWFPSKIIAVGFRILYSPIRTGFRSVFLRRENPFVLVERFQGYGSLHISLLV
jgi:hypothetical protein